MPYNFVRFDSWLKDSMGSLMQLLEKVAPAAGFPEVYHIIKTHNLDKRLVNMARWGLDALRDVGMTCNKGSENGNKRLSYRMGMLK